MSINRTQYDGKSIPQTDLAKKAEQRFESWMDAGRVQACSFFTNLQEQTPRDFLLRTEDLGFEFEGGRLILYTPSNSWQVHSHAMAQIIQRTGILNGGVSRKMIEACSTRLSDDDVPDMWGRDLFLHNLHTIYRETDRARVLVRVVETPAMKAAEERGQIRGFLSDKYRRMNSGPILHAFAEKANEYGAVCFANHERYRPTYLTDLKVGFSMFLPFVFEPIPGEAMVFGMQVSSSDFGAALLKVQMISMRITCSNMQIMRDDLKKVHLGGQLPDEIQFSEETYRADTKTIALAVRDLVEVVFSPQRINLTLEVIRAANEEKVDAKVLFDKLQRSGKLQKKEKEAVSGLYNGADVELMPPGGSLWRATQALSLFANQKEEDGDVHRAIDIRKISGDLMDAFKEEMAS
jgi:hypothetical protein